MPSADSGARAAQPNRMRTVAAMLDPGFAKPFVVVLAVAIAAPFVITLFSFVVFFLLFVLESIVIGAYPFLATIRLGASSSTYAIVFPFNWVLTVAQWLAAAWFLARRAKSKGISDLGSQVILACGLWVATNIAVRLLFLLLGISIVTTPVRM